MGLRIFMFSTSGTQNLWCIAHSMNGLREEKNEKAYISIPNRKYISIKNYLTENMVLQGSFTQAMK